jgi:DNA-binding response OmpR family regulator
MVEQQWKASQAVQLGAPAPLDWDTLPIMGRILIVEDERDLNDLVARQLKQDGHEVFQAYDGLTGLATVDSTPLDLVILDWMLPTLDGLAVARRIRENHIVPILMLTARGEETDIVLGLEVGADDYLTKPFKMRELLARARAIIRRSELLRGSTSAPSSSSEKLLQTGDVRMSLEMRSAHLGDEELDLTPKEFDLLAMFVQNPGRAFSRDYLLEKIWGDDVYVTDRTVDTHVQRLRKKLGDSADLIRTVWGIGYKLQRDS